MLDFTVIKAAVAAQFAAMQQHPMFRVDVTGDELWAAYLAAFPPGSNPMFRERTEHDCSCCKQFVRTVGNVVAVTPEGIVSMWETTIDGPYRAVADALAKLVKSKALANPFLHYEATAGTNKSFEQLVPSSGDNVALKTTRQWDHFYVNILTKFVAHKDAIPTKLGEQRTKKETLQRALETITMDACDTVLELIAQNTLYRGAEHKFAITEFRQCLYAYGTWNMTTMPAVEFFSWVKSATLPGSVSGIRNTSIGTLLVDLSEGMELDAAVRKFEAMVAPANYKRPTALVTPKMIEQAKEKITELGLLSALDRRFATLPDISINNVLFADRSARKVMGGNVFDDLAAQTSARAKVSDKIEEVPIHRFLAEIVPKADSIEVLFENQHAGNLVSLIAPVDPTAGPLFKWANNFSWSYSGEMADSIKEKVKKAGGNVTGDLCCRLAWNNADDLDLHLVVPKRGEISFRSRRVAGGMLDVDANGMDGIRENPVENIFFTDRKAMPEGTYTLFVNQYTVRSRDNIGFEAEIDYLGQITRFAYDKPQRSGENVLIAEFEYSYAKGIEIIKSLPSTQAVRTLWGLPTQTFHKVNVLCLSPNHWDEQGVGNKHYMFMLDGCVNDGTARGFFNEFLDSRLDPYRKVFEMVGSKAKPVPTPNGLSGLGFSSTQRNTLTVRVKGSFTRTINVVI